MSQRRQRDEERPIRFGTSGWRGILGDDFTFDRVRAAVAAIGDELARDRRGVRVLVGHDRRFLGERFAALAAAILAGRGLRPIVVRGAVPTPAFARAVRARRAVAGLLFTASHNPPEYQGLKLFDSYGASAPSDATRAVERRAAAWLRAARAAPCAPIGRSVEIVTDYLASLLRELDRDRIRRAGLRVVYDAMHGAGAGVLDRALRRSGAEVEVLRGAPDPGFGGEAPDPLPERLAALRRSVRAQVGPAIGIATDGDADRFAIVDSDGRVLSEMESAALLLDHLATTGRVRRGVALSSATGGLVERVARAHGLDVSFHPLGFKHLSRALRLGIADFAGEESGGFALAPFAFDKDGILAGCFMAELRATTLRPLRQRLRALERALGASASGRSAIAADPRSLGALEKLHEAPPGRVAGCAVREVVCCDGVRLGLDDGFVMLRASGTEPLVRVYAEAPDAPTLARRLRAGARLLQRGGRSMDLVTTGGYARR
ncbi:phosphomannomutase [Myxococcaceae bacterium]|nr:phosphomannomutase [Myxococcaceae bacterium]